MGKGRKGSFVVFICRNITPSLRYSLSLFLIEVAPLVYSGNISAKVREELWNQLSVLSGSAEVTMIFGRNSLDGFEIRQNANAERINTYNSDGVTLSQRRIPHKEFWEKVPGKTIPFEYPLILHLLDTMAVADVLWDLFISEKQKLYLSESLGVEDDEVRKLILISAGLHDIGKANPYWLNKTLGFTEDNASFEEKYPFANCSDGDLRKRHDFMGAVFVERDDAWKCDNTRSLLSAVIMSHHGNFRDDNIFDSDFTLPGEWENVQAEIESQVLKIAGVNLEFTINNDDVVNKHPGVVLILSGIVVLSDWIASSSRHIFAVKDLYTGDDYGEHYRASVKIVRKFVMSEGLIAPSWRPELNWADIFPHISTPNSLQESLIEKSDLFKNPGLVLMSAPMGMGKTEASLYIASQFGVKCSLSGVWLALPTRATTNVMFERMLGFSDMVLEDSKSTVSLMHSSSFIAEAITGFPRSDSVKRRSNPKTESQIYEDDVDDSSEDMNEFISSFLEASRQGGLSTIAVSTIDQLLQVSIPLKHNMLRWLGISGKVIILDEIHDFDRYTFGLILKFLRWASSLKIPVVVMSATLSKSSQFELLQAYNPNAFKDENVYETISSPGWMYVSAVEENVSADSLEYEDDSVDYATTLVRSEHPTDSILDIVEEELPNNPTVLVVCNTVNQAVSIFRSLDESDLGVPLFLLHSRMTEKQKHEVIEKILSLTGKGAISRESHILVSTQLVQQSIDIDYDVLITPVSPLPEIMQRIGRVHRHERSNRATTYEGNPKVFIIYPNVFDELDNISFEDKTFRKFHLPYSAAEVIASFETLKYLGLNNENAFKWKAKMNIEELLERKDLIYESLKNEKYFTKLSEFDEHSNFLKQNMQESVSVENPSICTYDMHCYRLTAPYTNKSSKAAKTRLISETVTVAFIEERGAKFFLAAPSNGEIKWLELSPDDFIETMKVLSRNSFSIPSYKYKELCKSHKIDKSFEKYEKNLEFAIYNADISIQSEGLVQSSISNETTWI